MAEPKVTSLIDSDGLVAAEIFWEDKVASVIRIGDETIAGTRDLFDASCVKVLCVMFSKISGAITDFSACSGRMRLSFPRAWSMSGGQLRKS